MAQAQPIKREAKTEMIQAPIFSEIRCYIHYVPEGRWKKAIEFFSDTLGLFLKLDTGEGWAEFVTPGVTFALHAAKDPYAPKDTGLSFAVEDCDIAVELLRARGVEISSEPRKVCDDGRSFEFKDPFGNAFGGYGK